MESIIQRIDKEELQKIVNESFSMMEVLNKLRLTGRGHSYDVLKKRLKHENITYEHFFRKSFYRYENIEEILVQNSKYKNTSNLKTKLITLNLKQNVCEICGQLPIHNNLPLSLHLDHINGDSSDNRLENLRILCPNCHTQTPTYSGKKTKKIKKNIACLKCNKTIKPNITNLCHSCYVTSPEKIEKLRKINQSVKKFSVSKEELEELMKKLPMTHIGKMFGVTDNAIRHRAKTLGIIY